MNVKPKLVITDIDGVWTDGGMYYDNSGEEWKKFNTSDSVGVLFLKYLKIPLAIVTGEDTNIVKRRSEKLKIEHLYLGVKNKVNVAKKLCSMLNISLSEVAFIGDDINDIELLKLVGFSATPKNAPEYIKKIVDVTIEVKGGDGAFRAFVEHIVKENNKMNFVLDTYKKSYN